MNEKTEFERGRQSARVFGGLVYTGVVLAATTLFISFVLTAFPDNAYFSRFIMGTAGLMIGASMLAFPIALHTWAISGTHRTATVGLYYGEMAIVALNTVVSFAALLFKFSGAALPLWVAWYEPFSIISIVYTLAAWGTIFLTDPAAKAKAKELHAEQEFKSRIANKKLEYLDSIEGEQAVLEAANAEILATFKPRTAERQHFGNARGARIPATGPFVRNELTTDDSVPAIKVPPDEYYRLQEQYPSVPGTFTTFTPGGSQDKAAKPNSTFRPE